MCTRISPGIAGAAEAAGCGAGAGLGAGSGSGLGAGVGSGLGAGVGSGLGAGVGSGLGAGVGSGVGAGVGSGSGSGSGVGSSVAGGGVTSRSSAISAGDAIRTSYATYSKFSRGFRASHQAMAKIPRCSATEARIGPLPGRRGFVGERFIGLRSQSTFLLVHDTAHRCCALVSSFAFP